MIRVVQVALLLSFLALPAAIFSQPSAQKLPTLVKEAEKLLEEKEPTWKIKLPYSQMSPPVMHLTSPQGDVLIYFWLMDNEVDAKDVFNGGLISLRNILGARKKESKLPDLGDDNYLISLDSGHFAHLAFYKRKTLIKIAAPTDAIAKRFAKHVAELVAPRQPAASEK